MNVRIVDPLETEDERKTLDELSRYRSYIESLSPSEQALELEKVQALYDKKKSEIKQMIQSETEHPATKVA